MYSQNYQNPKRMAERVVEYLQTPDGKKALKEVVARGTPFSDRLKRVRENISYEDLTSPMTI